MKNKKYILTLHKLIFVLPCLILFTVFFTYPNIMSFYYSLLKWDGIGKPVFVGLDNFKRVLSGSDKAAITSLFNTFKFALLNMIIQNPLSLLLAVLLVRPLKSKAILRTIFYIPGVVSLVAVSVTFSVIMGYNGVFNSVLKVFGQGGNLVDWLGNYHTAFYALVVIIVWGGLGGGAIIYIAGLQSIPNELYEAGYMEGINEWQKFWNITLPLLMPSVTIVTFLGLSQTLKMFDMPFVLTGGGPGNQTRTMSMYIYNKFSENDRGYSTALGLVFLVIIIIVVGLQMKLTRKREVDL